MSPPRYRLVVEGELGPRYATAFDGMTARTHKARRRSPGRSSTDRISASCSNGSQASASRCTASPTRSRSWRGTSASSEFSNQGERVVLGQRLMRAASDIFLGWVHVDAGLDNQPRDFYGRQLKGWKGSAEIEQMAPKPMATYGTLCGGTLARVHARSGDGIVSASCLGGGDSFDRAILKLSKAYADHNERDTQQLAAVVERAGSRPGRAADARRDDRQAARPPTACSTRSERPGFASSSQPLRSPGSGDDVAKDRRKPAHEFLNRNHRCQPVWRRVDEPA